MLDEQEGRPVRVQQFQDPAFRGSWSGYERDCLFVNGPGAKFYDAGQAFDLDFDDDGRAAAAVDVDGDGDLDLALLSLQGLRLMENRSPPRPFARVSLRASKGDPQAIGAQVILTAGGVTQRDFVKITSGFATQCPLDLHFGLGTASRIDELEVRWRDGSVEKHRDLEAGRRIVLRQGAAPAYETIPRWPDASRPRAAGGVKGEPGVHAMPTGETLVFDAERRLRRAFYRPVSKEDVAAVVNHLGKGSFHADFTSVATWHLSRREFEEAEALLAKAIAANPKYPYAHFFLGILRGLQERHGDAAASFLRTVELDPHNRQATHNLGVAYFKGGRAREAALTLRLAIELLDDAESRHVLGQALATMGKFDEAVREIRKSVELDAKRADAHGDLGKILLHLGRNAEAESSLERALELDPNHSEARANLRKAQGR